MSDDIVRVGDFVVIQKHNYKKLHKLNKPNSCVTLGRDSVDLTGINGCKYFSSFKLIPKSNKKNREFTIELVDEVLGLKDEIGIKASGADNRNIIDDGRSQKLSAAEIQDLKNDSNKAADIVETLITNSSTFHNKTEFSQEKYLKKKEKKYFEYVQVLRPNLRLIAEVMYKLESTKIQGITVDTLSQMITLANIHCEGTHLLYDSGSNGLVAAALLSAIGSENNGKLIHMHPGNMSQKQALLAMNFSGEQMNRCISVNVYSALRQYYQGNDTNDSKLKDNVDVNDLKRPADTVAEVECCSKKQKLDVEHEIVNEPLPLEPCSKPEPKKPKWHFENIIASELLEKKVDSLVIACKEDPLNIFNELVQFVNPGRPFVIYYPVAEPLQQMYVALRSQSNVAALKLTSNWMRNYQILPERTHPEVMMNGASGYLLSGYVLK